jgi:mono/diheme cytochrome c family protein
MAVAAAVALPVILQGARAETPVERGSYLVNTIMTCANCHSPKGPPAAVAGKDFSGGLTFDEPPFNLTPLKGPMGYQYYAKMTDADLDAVIAFVRTLPAID